MKYRFIPYIGLIACSVFYISIILTIIPFVGEQGESFSFLNHFISELGNPTYSQHHYIFNSGIILAGLGFGIFTYGLSGMLPSKLARISIFMGIIASFLCIGIGLVPSHHDELHFGIAASFFTLMTLAMTLYSICILMDTSKVFPKYIGFYGLCAMISFIFLIIAPKDLIAVQNELGPLFKRPEIWFVTIAEWLVFFFLTSWVVVVSFFLLWRQKESTSSFNQSRLKII